MEGASSSNACKKALCIICCYEYFPTTTSTGTSPRKGENSSPEKVEKSDNRSEGSSDDNAGSDITVKIIRNQQPSGSQEKVHIDQFLKQVVKDDSFAEEGVILNLARSVCKDCMDYVEKAVKSKERVDKSEKPVLRLQIELLKLLKDLNNHVGDVQMFLKSIQTSINDSNQTLLESRVKSGEIPVDVYRFRERIGHVLQNLTGIRSNLESKVNIRVNTEDQSSDDEKQESDMEEPIEFNRPLPNIRQKSNKMGEKSNNHVNQEEDNQDLSRDKVESSTASKHSVLQKRKREADSDDDNLVIAEDESSVGLNTVPPPRKKKTRNAASKQQKQQPMPLTKVSKLEDKKSSTNGGGELAGLRQSKRNKLPSSPKVSSPVPKKRIRRQGAKAKAPSLPTATNTATYADPKLKMSVVKLENLSLAQIEKIKAELVEKSKSTSSTATGKSPLNKATKVITRIISFDPSESSSNDDDDGITSSCSSSVAERDSLISYVGKIPTTKVSQWKRKVIIGLRSKMNYDEKQNAKKGLKPSKYTLEYNKRRHTLLFGKIPIVFYETDKNLGCSRCGPEFRFSAHENIYSEEIPDHMLTHLEGGKEGDTCSTLTSASRNKKEKSANWDPAWEEPDHSENDDEDEREEETDGDGDSSTAVGKDDAVIVPERCTRPKREKKAPARVPETPDKKDVDDDEAERSGAEEWAPPSSSGASDLDESDSEQKSPKKKVKKPSPSSKKVSPTNRNGRPNQRVNKSADQKMSANKTLLLKMIHKWNLGKEGKASLQLIKKKGLPAAAAFDKVICSHDDLGDIKVLGTKIIFNEQNSELECSKCTHVVKDVDLEDVSDSSQMFTAHRDIILHVLASHLNAFDCTFCGRRFTTPSAVSMHIKKCEQQKKRKNEDEPDEEDENYQIDSQKENGKKGLSTDDVDKNLNARKKISRFTTPTSASDNKSEQQQHGNPTGKIKLGINNYRKVESEDDGCSSDDDEESLPDIN